jgi:hypothetical protein
MHSFLKFIFGIKFYMFQTVPLSIIRSFSLYTQQLYISYNFADSLRAGSGWNILILPTNSQLTCMYCCMHSEKLLMMDRGIGQNLSSFIPKIN